MKSIIRKIQYLVIALVMSISTGGIYEVFAISEAERDFYSGNDIMFYTGEDQDAPVCGGVGFEDTGENLKSIFLFFKRHGLNDAQAAGVVGNIQQESGGIPTRSQSGPDTEDPSIFGTVPGAGKAWGLIQWDAGGRAIEYAKQAGITGPIHTLETQLLLIWWHMENTSPTGTSNMLEGYKKITDVAEATTYFHDKVEGSADVTMDQRIAYAKNAMTKYGSGGSEPFVEVGVGSGSSSGGCSENLGSIVKTALLYAYDWSPSMGPRITSPNKPEYHQAVMAAMERGEYIGPRDNPGVDCGAFVTRVMRDSGADPTYNEKNGNTWDQLQYVINSPKYTEVKPTNTGDLRPGDVAIRATPDGTGGRGNHTFIFVGIDSNGESYFSNGSLVAEASIGDSEYPPYPPQAGWSKPTVDPGYRFFRLNSNAES